jgi:hypothetical protein
MKKRSQSCLQNINSLLYRREQSMYPDEEPSLRHFRSIYLFPKNSGLNLKKQRFKDLCLGSWVEEARQILVEQSWHWSRENLPEDEEGIRSSLQT